MAAGPVLCPILVGREAERQRIAAGLAEARQSRGSLLLLFGEAGIGKSRLAREAESQAQAAGMLTLWGRSVESGEATPYRCIAEALIAAVRGRRLPNDPQLEPYQPILGRFIPAWASPAAAQQERSVVLLGEAVLQLIRSSAPGLGCLLVLEDLHWADADSLGLLDYLSANLAGESLLVLATARSDEPSAGLAMARSLVGRRLAGAVELSRLEAEATRHMAEACLAGASLPQPVQQALEASAEGLPLAVEDMLAEWVAAGQLVQAAQGWQANQQLSAIVPITFVETVRSRLARLGPDATRLLRVAALLGRRFDWRVLPGAAGMSEAAVLEILRNAVQRQLILADAAQDSSAFRFRHALTQAAILADVLPPERALLAASVLDFVTRFQPDLPGEWCDVAARLAEEAGDSCQAARFLLQSARRARASGALETVEDTLQRARGLCGANPDLALDVDELLVEALAMAGKHREVEAVGVRLLERLAPAGAAPARVVHAHLAVARAAVAASDWPRATAHLDAARPLARQAAAELLPGLEALAANVALGQGLCEQAVALAQGARLAAEQASQWGAACEALEVIGRAAREHDLAEAEAAFEQAQRVAEQHDLPLWRLRALHELGTIDIFRPERSVDRLVAARDLASGAGALAMAAMVDMQLAAAWMSRDDLDAVLASASRSAETAQRLHLNFTRAAAIVFVAEVYARRLDRPAMEASIAAFLETAGSEPTFEAQAWGDCRATASFVEDNLDRTLHELDLAADLWRRQGGPPSPTRGLWLLLRMLHGEDWQAAAAELEASNARINPVNQACLAFANAIQLGRQGRVAEASAQAEEAASLAAGFTWFVHAMHRLVAPEGIDRGWGHPVQWLDSALTYYERCSYAQLASACQSLLRKAGAVRPRVSARQAHVPPVFRARGVTDREMEVLDILQQGLSNREIGARLYLSPKTVEKHVASLMGKLDVRSRTQLAAIAASGVLPT